jgi:hypothetical protein
MSLQQDQEGCGMVTKHLSTQKWKCGSPEK